MEDRYGKYVRLFTTLVFTMLGLLIAFILFLLSIRLIFGLLDYIPWSVYLYALLVLSVPAVLFISVYIIYFLRSRKQKPLAIRYISLTIFVIALIFWGIFYAWDLVGFFKHSYRSIDQYHTYDMIFLAANVATIFLVGIMQAFSAPKQKDWMERYRDKQ